MAPTHWQTWHQEYDDPRSSLSRRLTTVRVQLTRILGELPADAPVGLISLCAGDGRDTIPILAAARPGARALLVELDAVLADAGRAAAADAGLTGVEVRTADAGIGSTYSGVAPAEIVLACGVFGNIVDADVTRTIRAIPALLLPGGRVIWTRGASVPDDPTEVPGDPSEWVRAVFAEAGFVEEVFVRPGDASFRVGVHRWPGTRASPLPERLFSFLNSRG